MNQAFADKLVEAYKPGDLSEYLIRLELRRSSRTHADEEITACLARCQSG